MGTTLDIANDVPSAAGARARHENEVTGEVTSGLWRRASTSPAPTRTPREPDASFGLRPFASRGTVVTDEMVSKLREEDVC